MSGDAQQRRKSRRADPLRQELETVRRERDALALRLGDALDREERLSADLQLARGQVEEVARLRERVGDLWEALRVSYDDYRQLSDEHDTALQMVASLRAELDEARREAASVGEIVRERDKLRRRLEARARAEREAPARRRAATLQPLRLREGQ